MASREDNSLDHLVLATHDVAETAAWLEHTLGVTPSAGGSHVGVGTHNQLCALGRDLYLEIIAPDPNQDEPIGPRPFGLDQLVSSGIATWCVRRRDLADLKRRAADAAMVFTGPATMQRQAPEGLLSWELLLPEFRTAGGIVPFFIDWGVTRHPSGRAAQGLELVSVVGEHPNVETIRSQLDALGVALKIEEQPVPALKVKVRGPAGEVTLRRATFREHPNK